MDAREFLGRPKVRIAPDSPIPGTSVTVPPAPTRKIPREFLRMDVRGKPVGAPLSPEEEQVVAENRRREELAQTFSGDLERFGAGVARGPYQFMVGVAELLGREPTQEERDRIERLKAARGPAATAGEIIGELGLLAAPGAAVARGARAATKAPGLARSLATLAGESGLVGGFEAGKLPMEDQTRGERGLRAAAITGATLGGLGIGGSAIRGLVAPRRFPVSPEAQLVQQQRREAGVSDFIPMFRALGDEPKGVQARLTRSIQRKFGPMLSGRKMAEQIAESDTAMRDTMFRRSLPEGVDIPLSAQRAGAENPAQDTAKAIRDFYSQEYGRLIDPLNIPVEGPWMGRVVDRAPKKAQKKIKDLLETSKREGILPGSNVKKVQSELRSFAQSKKALPSEKEAYWAVDDALEQTIQRRLQSKDPALLAEYQRLAAPYRNFLTVEDAVSKAAEQGGEFSAKLLVRSAKQKRGQPKSVVAAGEGPLQREAMRELRVAAPVSATDSPFLGLAMWGALTGAAPGAIGGAGAGLPIPLGFAAQTAGSLTRRGQQYLMSQFPAQQAFARKAEAMKPGLARTRAMAARLAGTQLAENEDEE